MLNILPTIAIVGRTNVGKSTLFNLIAGQDLAIVEDRPGVTRDRNYIVLNNYTQPFCLVDTGGLLGEQQAELTSSVKEQTEIAIHEADLIIALFDAKEGLHPQDRQVVQLLRKSEKPVVWVANKCEGKDSDVRAQELYSLGVDEIHSISAAHNQGIKQMLKAVWQKLEIDQKFIKNEEEKDTSIRVALLGKPNVGKSTFINKVLGQDRLITSPISGTTRDSIDVSLIRDGQKFILVDTAGLRKRKNIESKTIEQLSTFRTLKSIAICDIALLVIDATEGKPSDQDARIAQLIDERGKGLIIVVNKWDAVEKNHKSAKEYEKEIYEVFRFCKYAPIIFISALTGRRCPNVLTTVLKIYEEGKVRIKTNELNKMLEIAISKNPAPIYRGTPTKFYFASQLGENPPSFVLFFNNPKRIGEAYLRYLKSYIRTKYPYTGYDIKLIPRKRRSVFDEKQIVE